MLTQAKVFNNGERQVGQSIHDIRADHVARYEHVAHVIDRFRFNQGPGFRALDAACGVGYGSWLMAEALAKKFKQDTCLVDAIDISPEALIWARCHFSHPLVNYQEADLNTVALEAGAYNLIVAFECLEHLAGAPSVLGRLRDALAPGGVLACSVPNQDVLPFIAEAYPHHYRHYTPLEFELLITEAGLQVTQHWSNTDRSSSVIKHDAWSGPFIGAFCVKA